MEPTLGLLTGSGGGTNVEKDYMGMDKEAELELGLGLSLCSGGGEKGCAWGEYGRILTAKDFPNGFSSAGSKRSAAECGSATNVVSNQVVGWPPIRTYRMNTMANQAKLSNAEEDKRVGGNEKESSKKKINHGSEKNDAKAKERSPFGFVKVNVDGLPIGRKVDLSAHTSYETLAQKLEEMFFKLPSATIGGEKEQPMQTSKLLDGSSEFVLTYEDKEGDWMLVGDVPWGMFISTVKRLRIMRTPEANGLAPKYQAQHEIQKSRPI